MKYISLVKDVLKHTHTHITKKLEKESLVTIIGMGIEYYSVFLYGYASSVIISQFFNINSSLILWSSILLSYIMGPLGAIICGHIGDTLGRKKILVWTIATVSISSFLISILPSYDQIGVLASIFFIILRSAQTLAFGGDAVGLVTFILEDAPAENRGLFGGLMSAGSAVGVLAASFVIAFLDPFEDPASPWKWRLPLSVSIIGMLVAIYFYRAFGETETFKHHKEKRYINSPPIYVLFKNNKKMLVNIIGITALVPIITIIIFGFIPYLGMRHLGLSTNIGMWSNTLGLLIFTFFAPFFGNLSDRIGRRPILICVSLSFLILPFPLFYFLDSVSTKLFFIIQLLFSLISSAYYGVTMTTCIEHLPTHVRYTGVALGYYITYTLFGGINGQYIVELLIKDIRIDISPVFYLLLGSFLVFLSSYFLKEQSGHSLSEK
jgi:MHS family proline/betaine transporter-like MFS transporter